VVTFQFCALVRQRDSTACGGVARWKDRLEWAWAGDGCGRVAHFALADKTKFWANIHESSFTWWFSPTRFSLVLWSRAASVSGVTELERSNVLLESRHSLVGVSSLNHSQRRSSLSGHLLAE